MHLNRNLENSLDDTRVMKRNLCGKNNPINVEGKGGVWRRSETERLITGGLMNKRNDKNIVY